MGLPDSGSGNPSPTIAYATGKWISRVLVAVHVLGNGAVIDNVELVDNEFKLLNMVVDV
jgi:hypothetical protein